MNDLIPVSNLTVISEEPRILDVDLGTRLGMAQPLNIRTMIAANRAELEMHGRVFTRAVKTSPKGGRPTNSYYINEGQALVLCALSRTPIAAQIRKAIIDVFMAYRQGKVVQVKEHRRHKPHYSHEEECEIDSAFVSTYRTLVQFENQPRALIEVLARCVMRLDRLENCN